MGDAAGGPRKSGVGLASCVLAAVATLWLGWLAVEAVVTETAAGQPILLIPAGTFVLLLWIPVLVLAQAGWVLRTGPARAAAAAAVRGRHAALGLGVLGVVGGLRTAPTGGALTGTAVLIGLAMLPLSWTLSGSAEELERWVRRNARPTAGQSASSASVDPDVAAESEPYPYPMPLPAAARAAHLDALMDRGFRATAWGCLFVFAMLVACVPLFWGVRKFGPNAPSMFLTHPVAATILLAIGVLPMGIAVPPMVRHTRAKARHKRLLAAYGVNVTEEGEVLPARPRRW